MKREIDKLKNSEFDVMIIGGGIHGATIAYEASRLGFKTALIEKFDFGSQTSANSLKVLHGGLRYLQHANFKRMRESIYSRKSFQKIAPHLVRSVPFVIPTFGYAVKSKLALKIAMILNDLISFDRNKNIEEECFVPGGKTISKDKLFKIIPGFANKKVTGGAVWYESIAINTERLLFEFLHKAYEKGSVLTNYVNAVKYNFNNSNIDSVSVKDMITNDEFSVKAKIIINSVGPWLNEILLGTSDLSFLNSPLTKAVNVIIKKNLFTEYAVGLESEKEFTDKAAIINKGKRLFFFIPLGNYTMIGTTYKIFNDNPDNCKISDNDISEIINEINSSYKSLNLTKNDIVQTHVGVQAMPNVKFENEFDVQPETHSRIFDHKSEGNIDNLISIKSVKYTTAPSIAKNIIGILKNRIPNKHATFIVENIVHISKDDFFGKNKSYDTETLQRLWTTYGTKSQKVIEFIEKNEDSKSMIFSNEKVYKGEIYYCLNEELALTSKDILDRRIGLSALEKLPDEYYSKVDQIINKKK